MKLDLPDYANATPEDLDRACRAAVEECDAWIAGLAAVPAGQRTFGNTVLAVEEARAAVTETRAAWSLLADASPDDSLREAARECGERLGQRKVGIDFDEEVHRAVGEYTDGAEAAALTGEDARLLGDLLRDCRLKQARYAVDDLQIAQYLPLDACLEGLFAATGTLLGVRFEEVPDAPVWHPEVRTFDVGEAAGGEPFARFHLDLFPRPDKYQHAKAVALRPGRRLPDGSYQRPVAALLANLTRPTADRPSLLRHAELITLFHEFGHVLHEVLTRADRIRYAGAETEIDFVEAPSQMLEHLCWEPAALKRLARHYRTGEPMPDELLAGLIAARTAASGILTLWQLSFATLDLAYHSAGYGGDSTATLAEVYAQHGFLHIEGTHLQSSFTHLFGYDAAYYSYLWSQVLGDDMYTRFEAAGPLDPGTGAAYRRTILERGGTVGADLMVRDFLGRQPSSAAFLRGIGLAQEE